MTSPRPLERSGPTPEQCIDFFKYGYDIKVFRHLSRAFLNYKGNGATWLETFWFATWQDGDGVISHVQNGLDGHSS